MAITPGLQLPYGIQPTNPIPVDSLSGPFTGGSTAAATVATVDGNGAITGITIGTPGSGYVVDPAVTFGTGR